MRRNRGLILWALLTSLALIATGCQRGPSGEPAGKGGLFRVQLQEPGSLDPPLAPGSEDIIVVKQLFDGLVRYNDKTAKVEPAVATDWDINEDNTRYTFRLRKGTKFSNGEEVTAESFVRGWTRALKPEIYNDPSGLGYHLDGIKGAKEVSGGKATVLAGVKAVDKYTLEVELAEPDSEFIVRVGHMPFLPIPSDATIAGQKPSWAEFPIGNGPFKMKEPWVHEQRITLVRNDDYYGAKANLQEVVFRIFPDLETSYLEWQAGNLDWTRVPNEKFDEAKKQNPGNVIIKDMAGINYLVTASQKAPTDNKLFRQALSLAVDRKLVSDTVFFGINTPATGILPPLIPGSRARGTTSPCQFCAYDPAKAKQLFEQSGVKITGAFPMYFNAGAGHDAWMQAVAQQIETNLGFDTEAIAATSQFTGSQSYAKFLGSDAPGSANRFAWIADYPTPDNILSPLLSTGKTDNKSNYSNPTFDELLKQARAQSDPAKRVRLFQQAEDLALEDMPIIPLWWRTQLRLAKLDKFGGLSIDPIEDPTLRTVFVKSAEQASR